MGNAPTLRLLDGRDGPFSMRMPGLAFHNRNWPHIVKALRVSLRLSMAALPIVNLLAGYAAARLWSGMEDYSLLGMFLCGLFLSTYAAGKRHESPSNAVVEAV